jgi:hypothetical protein
MPLPSGTFSSPNPGRLQVTFTGQFGIQTGSDFGAGTKTLVLRAFIGSGPTRQTCILAFNAGESGFLERAYPGGNDPVDVGMEVVTYTLGGGPGSISFSKARITCVLIKR